MFRNESAMTIIRDEGSVFNAPVEKIWALLRSPGIHRHPSMANLITRPTELPNSFILAWDAEVAGHQARMVVRYTVHPPLGFVMEFLEGPLAGSKEFEYYIPQGGKTVINVVGDYRSSVLPDPVLKSAVLTLLAIAFEEDQRNLAAMEELGPSSTLSRPIEATP